MIDVIFLSSGIAITSNVQHSNLRKVARLMVDFEKLLKQSECEHDWKNDPMFEDGVVEMFTSMNGQEMRQGCPKCGKVRYIPKQRQTRRET